MSIFCCPTCSGSGFRREGVREPYWYEKNGYVIRQQTYVGELCIQTRKALPDDGAWEMCWCNKGLMATYKEQGGPKHWEFYEDEALETAMHTLMDDDPLSEEQKDLIRGYLAHWVYGLVHVAKSFGFPPARISENEWLPALALANTSNEFILVLEVLRSHSIDPL